MNTVTFNRKELFDLIWAEPILNLINKYDTTHIEIKKICEDMNIPMPETGYWSKLRAGKEISRPILPETNTELSKIELYIKGKSPLEILQKEIEETLSDSLIVPSKLVRPDELITAAKESLSRKRNYDENGIKNTAFNEISIRASNQTRDRALRFMDTLIKNLRKRGFDVKIFQESTYVFAGEEKIRISFREKTKRVKSSNPKYRWENFEYIPTGILIFQMENHYPDIEWQDGKIPIEQQLSKILARIELKSQELKEQRLEIQRRRIEYEKEKTEKQRLEKIRDNDLDQFKLLLMKAERWKKSEILREYISHVQTKDNNSEESKNWIEWARKKNAWYDPTIEATDENLTEINRDTLEPNDSFSYFNFK